MSNNIIVLSGGFDPLHEGHIAMFKEAKQNFDYVIVGVNSDSWLKRKKGKYLLPFNTRFTILSAIRDIDVVYSFTDDDNTAINLLQNVVSAFPESRIYFGNGGDRSNGNYPELEFCKRNNIKVVEDLGGSFKLNSSSDLLRNWSSEDTALRDWGTWRVLTTFGHKTKIKELVVFPNKSLSWQKHEKRAELWHVREGTATVYLSDDVSKYTKLHLGIRENITIPIGSWHSLENNSKLPLSIIEIQYGEACEELDIIRAPRPTLGGIIAS